MIPNFELRFVKRIVTGRHVSDGFYETIDVKILQYRTRELGEGNAYYFPWSEWQDVPVEDEDAK